MVCKMFVRDVRASNMAILGVQPLVCRGWKSNLESSSPKVLGLAQIPKKHLNETQPNLRRS